MIISLLHVLDISVIMDSVPPLVHTDATTYVIAVMALMNLVAVSSYLYCSL